MSESVIKGAKRLSSRPATRSTSAVSPAKNRKLSVKPPSPQPLAKRSGADKAPVRKATKSKTVAPATAKSPKKSPRADATPTAKPKFTTRTKTAEASPRSAAKTKTSIKTPTKTSARPLTSAAAPAAAPKQLKQSAPTAKTAAKKPIPRPANPAAAPASARSHAAPTLPRQPTLDEAAALRAFERAHKEFVRGRFTEARMQFRALIEQHSGVAEVAARARTYLNIAEARMRTESALPRSAEELYDRGVIELNRGEFVAAQELFERALKRDTGAAHVYYGLAATRARLGALEPALQSLRRALEIQPNLRVRAQHDPDFSVLRNDSEYERMIFASRP